MTQWSHRFLAIAALAAAFSRGALSRVQGVFAEVRSMDVESRSMRGFVVNRAAAFPGRIAGEDISLINMGWRSTRKFWVLRTAKPGSIVYGWVAPPLSAPPGNAVAHAFALPTHSHIDLGTFPLSSVPRAAASHPAVPAVQRPAIPESRPSLSLASSPLMAVTHDMMFGMADSNRIAGPTSRARAYSMT